jgi:hypothetical protein
LVEGEDLSQFIARGPLALAEVLPIARQICEALFAWGRDGSDSRGHPRGASW